MGLGEKLEKNMTIYLIIAVIIIFLVCCLIYVGNKIKSSPSFVCNHLIKDNLVVYQPMDNFSQVLKVYMGGDYIIYSEPVEARSDEKVLKDTGGVVFCSVPVEVCSAKEEFMTISYCMLFKLEVPVLFEDWREWYDEK